MVWAVVHERKALTHFWRRVGDRTYISSLMRWRPQCLSSHYTVPTLWLLCLAGNSDGRCCLDQSICDDGTPYVVHRQRHVGNKIASSSLVTFDLTWRFCDGSMKVVFTAADRKDWCDSYLNGSRQSINKCGGNRIGIKFQGEDSILNSAILPICMS